MFILSKCLILVNQQSSWLLASASTWSKELDCWPDLQFSKALDSNSKWTAVFCLTLTWASLCLIKNGFWSREELSLLTCFFFFFNKSYCWKFKFRAQCYSFFTKHSDSPSPLVSDHCLFCKAWFKFSWSFFVHHVVSWHWEAQSVMKTQASESFCLSY